MVTPEEAGQALLEFVRALGFEERAVRQFWADPREITIVTIDVERHARREGVHEIVHRIPLA